MLPAMRPASAPFDSSDWISLAYIGDDRCHLVSRKNNPYKSFGPLREALAGLFQSTSDIVNEVIAGE
jgi:hypothetical protein